MLTYTLGVLVTLSIFGLLAVSLDLLIGYTGMFTLVHGALFGAGAYSAGILSLSYGIDFWAASCAGTLAGALISLLIAIPSLRVSGHYLVLASFGVQEVLSGLFLNLGMTGGPAGLRGIPRPNLFGFVIQSNGAYLIFYVLIVAIVLALVVRLVRSPFGLLLKAIREDELAPQALGKNIFAVKIKAFVISGGIAGLMGALYAQYVTFISPESFDVNASIFILSMVLIGGMGSIYGAAVGAAILIILPEMLRFLPLDAAYLGPMRQLLYGAILVAFCFLRPRGLIGARGGDE